MTRKPPTVNRQALSALTVLGDQIRLARHQRGMSAKRLAFIAGVSERTVLAAEHGDPAVSIGTVFNLAAEAGVHLFDSDEAAMARLRTMSNQAVALLPAKPRLRRRHATED